MERLLAICEARGVGDIEDDLLAKIVESIDQAVVPPLFLPGRMTRALLRERLGVAQAMAAARADVVRHALEGIQDAADNLPRDAEGNSDEHVLGLLDHLMANIEAEPTAKPRESLATFRARRLDALRREKASDIRSAEGIERCEGCRKILRPEDERASDGEGVYLCPGCVEPDEAVD